MKEKLTSLCFVRVLFNFRYAHGHQWLVYCHHFRQCLIHVVTLLNLFPLTVYQGSVPWAVWQLWHGSVSQAYIGLYKYKNPTCYLALLYLSLSNNNIYKLVISHFFNNQFHLNLLFNSVHFGTVIQFNL